MRALTRQCRSVFQVAFARQKVEIVQRQVTVGAAAALLFTLTLRAEGSSMSLGSERLFTSAVSHDVRLTPDRSAIELNTGELVEDDGPAAGHSYQKPKNEESLDQKTWIKKELIIPRPQARAAFLVVLSETPFEALMNGTPLTLGSNQSGRQGYKACAFDPHLLKAGRNEIVLRGSGQVLIAREDEFALGSRTRTEPPHRSAKSTDAGKTWDYNHLGVDGQLQGEYGVRVFLDQYLPKGSLLLPVIDAANLAERTLGVPLRHLGPVQITVDGDLGKGGQILVRARSGRTYVPSDQSWSPWLLLSQRGGSLKNPLGRYVQVEIELVTQNPLSSPQVKQVRVTANPMATDEDWTSRVRVLDSHNEQIVRTSIPFEYEPLDHPHLKELREKYHLDEVVKGAHGELELMLRLAQWACNYWDWPNHISEQYPPWDALEILKPDSDGTPVGGFCQQFNLVFLQACESFGFSGRATSISQGRLQEKCPGGGHEVVELWSNEWHKWVYVDGALAWYIVDEKTGTPLSLLELRQRQLALERGDSAPAVRVVDAVRTRNKQFQWSGLSPKPLNWYFELRMIPRSNFLQEKSPLPLNQGTEEWAWTGHYVWTDNEVPAGLLFGHRVSKFNDFEWTLNQAHYVLEPEKKAGSFRVHLDTETPSLQTFVAEMDGAPEQVVRSGFAWQLHPGTNSLKVRPRNVAGREGIPSWITLEYHQ